MTKASMERRAEGQGVKQKPAAHVAVDQASGDRCGQGLGNGETCSGLTPYVTVQIDRTWD